MCCIIMPVLECDMCLTYHASHAAVQCTFAMLAAEQCSFATGKMRQNVLQNILHQHCCVKEQYTGAWGKFEKQVQGWTGRKYENLVF